METIFFDKDLKVFYVTASSFPDGILAAHEKLHALVPFSTDRKYYGISRPEHDKIVYLAATEELYEGEAKQFNCETLLLKKGNYISLKITDYMKDTKSIGSAFEQLLTNPDLDPKGYCVEWYVSDKEMVCMIRLAN